jgi:tetratricopeptide (TPR) repeat protein
VTLSAADVRAQLDELANRDPGDAWRWVTEPTWSEAELAAFEATHFKLPPVYRAWLHHVGDGGIGFLEADGGFRKLSSQSNEELALAGKRFRVAKDMTPSPGKPIGGLLHIGEDEDCPVYLVTNGKRAGEVWIDGGGYGDDVLFRHGTFAELTEAWIRKGREEVDKALAPRTPAALDAIEPKDRFWHQCSDLVPWLRCGSTCFVEAFEHAPAGDRDRILERGLVNQIERERRWLHDPALALVAAETLTACLARLDVATDELDRALDAMYDHDPPDIAPERVTALLAAYATRRGLSDDRINRWSLKWLQGELVRAGRIDEALEVWRNRFYLDSSDWVELARQLIAVGRAADAFAIANERKYSSGQHWGADDRDWKRGWMHLEAGDRQNALIWMERAAAAWPQFFQADFDKLASNEPVAPPPSLTSESRTDPPRARRHTRHHELAALLFGIAGDAEHMADVAIGVLSRPAAIREPREAINHRAHLRMARALAGHRDDDADELDVRYGDLAKLRKRLAVAILERTGDLGIRFSSYSTTDG